MATPTNAYSTFDAETNREDLANDIWDVSPTETPFMSTVTKNEATNTLHEWSTDELEAASASNAVIEGEDATVEVSAPKTRLNNYTQISDKTAQVTGSQRAADVAGLSDELDYQMIKKGKALKTDMESALLANKAKVVGDTSTARELAGIEAWISSNVNSGSGAVEASGDGSDDRTAGTSRSFAEDQLKDVLAQCYDAGGDPNLLMLGSFNKQAASSFVGDVTRKHCKSLPTVSKTWLLL